MKSKKPDIIDEPDPLMFRTKKLCGFYELIQAKMYDAISAESYRVFAEHLNYFHHLYLDIVALTIELNNEECEEAYKKVYKKENLPEIFDNYKSKSKEDIHLLTLKIIKLENKIEKQRDIIIELSPAEEKTDDES